MRFASLVAIAAAALLLAGCVPVSQVPPEPSGAELDALIAKELDFQWQYVGLTPDAPRPTVDRIRVVSPEEATDVHRDCMVDAGYGDFRQVTASIYGGASNLERLAIYTCSAQYPVPPASYGLFSTAQLDFLYDYYVEVTIPCIRADGFTLTDIPTRQEFTQPQQSLLGVWVPWDSVQFDGVIPGSRCTHVPEGFGPF